MTDSVAILRKKRGFRRGQLTKMKNYLDELSAEDPRKHDLDNLISLQTSIEEEASHHRDLQSRMEELLALEEAEKRDTSDEETAFTREMESGADFKKLHQSYIDTVSTLIKDFQLYKESEELGQACSDWSSAADPSSRTFMDEGKDFISKLDGYMSKTSYRDTAELIKSCRAQTQTLRARVRKLMHEVKAKEEVDRPTIVTTRDHIYRPKFDLEMPSFNGQAREWRTFAELFRSTMEKEGRELREEHKTCLLIKALKDPAAKDIAQRRIHRKEGYDAAFNALEKEYGAAHVLIPLHIQTIQSSPSFDFDRESLTQLDKTITATCDDLLDMKVDLSTYLTAYAVSKFKPKLADEWTRYTTTMTGVPNHKDLARYTELLLSRMPVSSNGIPSAKSNFKPSLVNVKLEKKPTSIRQCIACNDGIHSLASCSTFKGYTPEKRGKIVRDKRWCANCLHPSHTVQNCTSAYTCKTCSLKHHTLLHRGDGQAESSTPSNSGATSCMAPAKRSTLPRSGPLKVSFLSTALVTAIDGNRQRTARLAFDSGSSTSMITESLASQLKLKRSPNHLVISGAYGDGISKSCANLTLVSRQQPQEQITLSFAIVSRLPTATPPRRTDHITSQPQVKTLQLADENFGGKLDILLGNCDTHSCVKGHFTHIPDRGLTLTPTLFGWTVSGPLLPGQTSKFLSLQTSNDELAESLKTMWKSDQVPESTKVGSTDEQAALQQFDSQVKIDDTGRYSVSLPKTDSPKTLGKSRNTAIQRFLANERSLSKKQKLADFDKCLKEYSELDHAELVPDKDINRQPSYYLPVHGVFKTSSTTTKIRPVFDASAKSSNGVALNDLILPGPNLYPLLTDLLVKFRDHKIAFSADISKMFREILLNTDERDLHRFLMRDAEGKIRDHRMKRLTFGVKSSPFLATKVLHHLAEKHALAYPVASRAILNDFYVDDFLSGAETLEEASHIRHRLCELLQLAGMTLRKWRTSCPSFAATIPEDLLEKLPLDISDAPKALGVHWDTSKDTLQISVPTPPSNQTITKRMIASNMAKVYDILGLFTPFSIRAKILLQEAWKSNCDWDEEVTEDIRHQWIQWTSELQTIHDFNIARRYADNPAPVKSRSLHGYSDASIKAYGAVVYLRQQHTDNSISTTLVMSKARVAPLKTTTIPRAELVAAVLLTKLLTYISKLLDIPSTDLHPWTDSTIVLCWTRKSPSSLQTFVANRIAYIQQTLPDVTWRHISTKENPADLLSRGVPAATLLCSTLWWVGPLGTSQTPIQSVTQSVCHQPSTLPELRAVTLTASAQDSSQELWKRYSSFHKLTRIVAWIRRFLNNIRKSSKTILTDNLQAEELQESKTQLLRLAQQHTYPTLTSTLGAGKRAPSKHPLDRLNVSVDKDGLLVVSGRVRHDRQPKTLIALSLNSEIVRLMITTTHISLGHPGISPLMAILGDTYYIPGLKTLLKKTSRNCAVCQRAYAKTTQPPMGLLPKDRTTPAPPFSKTGLDFAGPLTIKVGHIRRPTLIKSYLCLFVCFTTKAVHAELCADMTTEEFMAALRRFCDRRGTPAHIYSDNGTTFQGAAREFRQIEHLVNSSKKAISHFATKTNLHWHFIPPRAPHFGGLWEAGVRQAKTLLRKLVSPHPLTFNELNTVVIEVEAILNSRPIMPLDTTELENDLVLTPGHFLIGRPLKSPARLLASKAKVSSLRRWTLVQRLQQDLWSAWQTWYLSTLSRRNKWKTPSQDIKIGDIVLVKDEALATPYNWPLAKVTSLYPGSDNIVRTVDLLCNGKTYKRAVNRLVVIHQPTPDSSDLDTTTSNMTTK